MDLCNSDKGDCSDSEAENDKFEILEIIKDNPKSPNNSNLYEPFVQVIAHQYYPPPYVTI